MTASVQPFTFPATGQPVRTLLADEQAWFVAKDSCDVLGISKYRDAVAQLDADERASMAVDTPGGPQTMTVVNEPGVYALMMISRSPQAKAFRRWVTHEVLPAIRKTGSYAVAPMDELELAERNVLLIKEKRAALARAEVAETKVAELAPMADLAERYLKVPTGGRILREVAKALGLKETALRTALVNRGVIFKRYADCGEAYWDAQARYFTEPHPKFRAKETVVVHDDASTGCLHYTLYILQPGVDLICRWTGRGQQMELEAAP
jgi:prophage antirepressor-like protein